MNDVASNSRQTTGVRARLDQMAMFVAIILLALQSVGVAWAPWSGSRFFAWAPHDQLTQFSVRAWSADNPKSPSEIAERYRLPKEEWHHWGNLVAVIRTAEQRQPAHLRWRVALHFRVNRGEAQRWCYPDACGASD